jgi:hypothetical protein
MSRDEWKMQMLILTHEESDAEHFNAALHTLEAWDIAQRMKINQQDMEIARLQKSVQTMLRRKNYLELLYRGYTSEEAGNLVYQKEPT